MRTAQSRPVVLCAVALAVLLTSCSTDFEFGFGDEREDAAHVSTAGDAVLDCADGLVSERLELADPVLGSSEEDVVEQALAAHMGADGELRALPPDDSWMVVEDGRDVALVYPLEASDGWRVESVTVCGPAPTGLDAIDGSLDCVTDVTWSQQGSASPDAVGAVTAEEALREVLAPYANRLGGEIVIEGSRGSLVSGFAERVVAIATQMNNGTWVVLTISGCEGTS